MMRAFVFLFPIFCLFSHNIFANKPSHPLPAQPLTVEIEQVFHVSCHGGSDGAIYLTVQGNEPFMFEWNTGSGEPDLTDIPAGTYSVTVTDAEDVQVVLTAILVEQPAPLTLTLGAIQHINCLNPQGALSVAPAGGTLPFQYLWSNDQTGATAGQLPAGTYTVTVTDDHGCMETLSAGIQQDIAPPFAQAGAPQNLLCSNSITTLNGNGSSGALFTYTWTPSNGGNVVSGGNTLSPTVNHTGTYTLRVTNTGNGCTAESATTIGSQFLAPAATAGGGALTCAAASITLQATRDAINTVYGWTGPNNYVSQLFYPTVSVPGNYVFTVTDTITGCFTAATALVVTDMVNPTVSGVASGAVSCLTPSVTLTASSNLPTAIFKWTGPNNYTSNNAITAVSVPGTYTITATNPQNGCTASALVVVGGNTTPPTVTAAANNMLTCTIFTVQLSGAVQPVNGTTYKWTGPNNFSSNLLNPGVSSPGVYTLTATSQANGCTASASATVVLNNSSPSLSATGGTKTCTNPTVTLKANSTVPGLTFYWTGPGGFTSGQQNPVVSVAGFYTVLATNPVNGCTNSAGVNVASNLAVPVLLTNTSTITCANPIGKPTASSTTPGATFAWSGPGGFTFNGPNPQVTLPGFYTVVATHPASGCTSGAQVQVFDNTTTPNAYAGEAPMLNCMNAVIQLNGTGSSTGNGITYLWTTFDGNIVSGTLGLFPRVNAVGTYTLKVTNTQNGCTALDSIEIIKAPTVTALINQVVHVACNGTATGSATVKPGGGNGTYTYAWSTGSNTATATGLSAGLYTVTVSDSEGCSAGDVILINQPTALQALVNVTPQTIFGVNNGAAGVSPNGGTSPYSFKWNTGPVTATIINLAPGAYTVTITDNKGCTLVKTANVNAVNCTLGGSIATTNVSCSGAANGSATANMTGGTNPVNYFWSNNAQTKTISNLAPGTYKVTVADASGCSTVLSAVITSPDPVALVFAAKENVTCTGAATGVLTAGVSGGTTPYAFAWSNGATTAGLTGLGQGAYTVTVTDAKGCSKSLSAQITITDQNPPQLVLKNATVALGANGTATVTPAMFDNGSFDAECSIASWTVSPTGFDCAQLGVRTVTLTATDVNGNSKTGTATVTITDNIVPAVYCPENKTVGACTPVVQFTLPNVTDNCAFDPANLSLKNGLAPGSVFPVGKTLQTYTYTDAAGNSAECNFEITVEPLPAGDLFIIPASCSGTCNGAAILTLTAGNVPASGIDWGNGQTGFQVNDLCMAAYTVTLQDVYGCSLQLPFVVPNANNSSFEIMAIAEPAGCTASCDGLATVSIGGGTGPFDISWSNGVSGTSATNLCPGPYTATVTDANGCSQVQPFQIDVVDNVAPKLLCPANITTSTCAATLAYNLPGIQDNCPTDPQQLQFLGGLPSGSVFPLGTTTQTFRYTDAAGNSGECSFTVLVHGPPALSVSATSVSCAGDCNGTATLTTIGGYGPFNVLWSNGQTGVSAAGLCAGTYTATVTDAAGCKQTSQTTIQSPAALGLDVVQLIHDIGNNGSGSIQISVTGGVQPYSFAWTRNGQFFASAQNLLNLISGQYAVVVTDANGCVIGSSQLTLNNTVASHEAPWAAGLRLYPNPASRFVQITLAEPLGQEAEVRLINANGALFRTEQISAADAMLRLDINEVPAGFWLVLVRTADGKEAVRKLVVER